MAIAAASTPRSMRVCRRFAQTPGVGSNV